MEVWYKFARENLFLAEEARKAYFDKSVKKRNFFVGDKVLVKFPMVPKGVNPKFFKKWRGGFVVVKKVGNLNLLVRASPHSKSIPVHVDRVKHAHPNDQLVKFDPEKGKDRPFGDPPMEEDLSLPLQHYSPEADFGAYIESASESEDESAAGEQASEAENEDQPAQAGQPALRAPADMSEWRVTRGAARDLGLFVPDIQLPDRCWSSSTYRK